MSAYGTVQPLAKPSVILSPTIYLIRRKTLASSSSSKPPSSNTVATADGGNLTHVAVFHLTLQTAPPELIDVLFQEFSDELERDETRTYPQEKGMTKDEFVAYYFARDVFVGLGLAIDADTSPYDSSRTLEDAKGGRDWKSALVGFYYVCTRTLPKIGVRRLTNSSQIKPNYPGHSSHVRFLI